MTNQTEEQERPCKIASTAQQFLNQCDEHFVPALKMTQIRWQGNGYHSRYPNNTWASPTRDNLDYALALFDEGSPASIERADAIVRSVLELQDLDPVSDTYGIWPWLREEPLEQMAPPDWNWADFCGIRLAHILGRYGDRVTLDLSAAIKISLKAAAYSIFRRNVEAAYTNIAIKGAIVCSYAGQLLNITELSYYGQRRLENFVQFTIKRGGFQEYNSPTYGVLVAMEIERGLMLITDPLTRKSLHEVHRLYWEQTAYSLHVPLGQICGPQSRAYTNWLSPNTARFISERLGIELNKHNNKSSAVPNNDYLLDPIPCPSDIREDILSSPQESFARYTYTHADYSENRRESSIWKSPQASIGSINYDNLWTQRRPVLGYWQAENSVAVLRVRLMHDGNDFASGVIRTQQKDNDLVSIVSLVTDKGDFHDHLDQPETGIFNITQLELRIELTAPDARAKQVGENRWQLQAGSYSTLVIPSFAILSGHDTHWHAWSKEGVAGLSALIDKGENLKLCPSKVDEAAFGFFLHLGPNPDYTVSLSSETSSGEIRLTADRDSGSQSVTAPLRPEAYSESGVKKVT